MEVAASQLLSSVIPLTVSPSFQFVFSYSVYDLSDDTHRNTVELHNEHIGYWAAH